MRKLIANSLLFLATLAVFVLAAEWIVPHVITLRDVGASFTEHDPVTGKRLKKNFEVTRVGPEFTWRFATNSIGTRGDEPPKPLQGPVVFLGDSFTMGYGVSNGEEYPALLGAEFRRRWGDKAPYALNLGIGNSGNGAWNRHLDHTVPPMKPRLVVMEVLQNDFLDNLTESLYDLSPEGRLVELPVPPPSRMRQIQQFIERSTWIANSNLLALARQAIATTPGAAFAGGRQTINPATAIVDDEKVVGPGDPLTLKIVEAAIQRCQQRGWPVLVLSVGLTEARRLAVAQMVKATGAPLLELPGKSQRPDLYFKIDGHWNVKGNADTARQVMAKIDELGLLKID